MNGYSEMTMVSPDTYGATLNITDKDRFPHARGYLKLSPDGTLSIHSALKHHYHRAICVKNVLNLPWL